MMKIKNRVCTGFGALGVVLACLLLMPLTIVNAGPFDPDEPKVNVSLGKADTIDVTGEVADILVADPGIADVGALKANRLYVVGRGVGDTNVLVFDEHGDVLANIQVHVSIDQKNLEQTLKEFFPNEEITARTVNSDVVLTGVVSTPSVANQVRDLAGRFITEEQTVMDLMTVKAEQQVMLRVRVVEANRSALRELGLETDLTANATSGLLDGLSFDSAASTGLTADPFGAGTITLSDGQGFGPLQTILRALERDGLVNTLAEPNLTAISGEQAGFLAGGEFPVPVATDEDGNITIEFKPFGVSLSFRPVVMSEERISLQIQTEVSTLSERDSVVLTTVEIPGLQVRRAETTVELGSGSTLMIAGLIQSETTNALNGLPGVNDLPIIGELFKSRSFEQNESEVVIMVTPYLVQPYAENNADEMTEVEEISPLASSFTDGLKTIYGDKLPQDLIKGSEFGYILD